MFRVSYWMEVTRKYPEGHYSEGVVFTSRSQANIFAKKMDRKNHPAVMEMLVFGKWVKTYR